MRRSTGAALTIAAGGFAAAALAGLAAAALVRSLRTMPLTGRVVLITGGSRGLGLEMAREFARHGCRVAICGREEATLDRAVTSLQREFGRAHIEGFACDVSQKAQVDDMVRNVRLRLGPVSVLVNNAGIIEVGPLESMTIDDFDECMRTHFWGPLYTTLAVLPGMKAARAGRIVNIASIGGKVSTPHLLPYSASKFALVGLSEGLRAELRKDNILVTTVCPGLMRTGSPRHAIFKGQHKKEYAWFSISDSLPLISMDSGRAARAIVQACRHGDAHLVLGPPAKLAAALHGVLPGLVTDIMALVHRLLPAPGGIGTERAPGRESRSALSPSWLTRLDEQAAHRNNQVA